MADTTNLYHYDWDLPTAAKKVAEGLPAWSLERVRSQLDLSKREFADIIQISERTLNRRAKEERLSVDESDRVYRLACVIDRATDVLGGIEQASGWMKEPNVALGAQTPLDMIRTEPGATMVRQLLGRIEHGVPA
jgi:putative toxin-antitoxin system antitoxin component (TIGR02293 family)